MVHFVSKLAFKPIARYVHAHSGGVCDRICINLQCVVFITKVLSVM